MLGPETGIELSDHFLVRASIPIEGENFNNFQTVKFRKINRINLENFKSDINKIANYNLNSKSYDELNYVINNLNSNLLKIINNHAPFIEKKVKIRKHLVVNYKIIGDRRFKKIERKYKKNSTEKR